MALSELEILYERRDELEAKIKKYKGRHITPSDSWQWGEELRFVYRRIQEVEMEEWNL